MCIVPEHHVRTRLLSADLAMTYSPASSDEVPSALGRFTAEFGMGSGAATPP